MVSALATCMRCPIRHVSIDPAAASHIAAAITAITATTTTTTSLPTSPARARRAYSHQRSPSSYTHRAYTFKRFSPHGRVVGTGRKRQRVVSADLQRKSLDQPASVIVFHDIHEPATSPGAVPRRSERQEDDDDDLSHGPQSSLSARDIEHAITGRQRPPEEAEINTSIHDTRPQTTLLDQAAFEQLRQQLVRSYTLPQLSHYLRASLRPPSADQASAAEPKQTRKALRISPWQPLQTPLDVRRPMVVQPTALSRKLRTAERIIRLAWSVTVDAEEQAVGELELMLQPWQLSMLFDLCPSGQPYYKSLVTPRLLLESTTVQNYRRDGVARVTGRRRDAEQVAYQLERALMSVQHLDMDLARLVSKVSTIKDSATPRPGRCTDKDLSLVSKLTTSVICSRGPSTITIYNRTSAGVNHACRLILSLLDLSSVSGTTYELSSALGSQSGPSGILEMAPVDASISGLHARWKGYDLVRRVKAASQIPSIPVISPDESGEIARDITSHLRSLEWKHRPVPSRKVLLGHGYWQNGALLSGEWDADVVKLLQVRSASASDAEPQHRLHAEKDAASAQSIAQRHLPAVDIALSYFDTYHSPNIVPGKDARGASTSSSQQIPHLIAYLVPAPHSKGGGGHTPPRAELHFEFATWQRELNLTSLRVVLETQTLNVSLPTRAVDLAFARSHAMVADIGSARLDPHISAFFEDLKHSVQATDGAIAAPPELIIHLPAWLVSGSHKQRSSVQDIPITYLLERFEQRQKKMFVAQDDSSHAPQRESVVQLAMDNLGTSLHLEYQEVDGGAIYGSCSTLSVKRCTGTQDRCQENNQPAKEASKVGLDDRGDSIAQVVSAAVTVADLMTHAAEGSLRVAHSMQ